MTLDKEKSSSRLGSLGDRRREHDRSDETGRELQAVRLRELELKRARGEISCAECRRLKLKCDKKVPCSSCKRRGCQNICPTGTNPPTYTPASKLSGMLSPARLPPLKAKEQQVTTTVSRSFASHDVGSDDATRAKFTAMSERIRALEDALQIEFNSHQVRGNHAEITDDTFSNDESPAARITRHCVGPVHPLLVPELLTVKNGIETFVPREKQEDSRGGDDGAEDMVSAFGTLSIKDGKNMQFLGASATDQTLLMEVFEKEQDAGKGATLTQISNEGTDDNCSLPPYMEQASTLWPFAPSHLTTPQLMIDIVKQLPPIERASALIEAYFTNLAWFLGPIGRSQVTAELIPLFYPLGRRSDRTKANLSSDDSHNDKSDILAAALEHPHDLALLLSVFASGAVADLTQAPDNAEGSRYHTLSLVTLGLQNIFEGASLSACQAIFINGTYEVHCGKRTGQEKSWKMFSLAMSLGNSIGLHRDPSRWNLDEKTVQRRRGVFWELYTCDQWKSLSTGRPPIYSPNVIDVELPEDNAKLVESDGTEVHCVCQWRYKFARDVLPHLVEKLCSARVTKYSEILELDRRVRDFPVHPYAERMPPKDKLGMDPEFFRLHPLITVWHREMALLYVHRNFFARAIMDFPDRPLHSVFAPSVLSTYRSASSLLRMLRESYHKLALLLFRMWPIWLLCLSSAVILAHVSNRPSVFGFAHAAFHELELSITLFEKATAHPVVGHGLPLLRRLRDKARLTLSKYSPGHIQHPSSLEDNEKHIISRELSSSQNNGFTDFTLTQSTDMNELMILRGVTRLIEQRSSSRMDISVPSQHTSSVPEETNRTDTSLNESTKRPEKSPPKETSTNTQKTYTEIALEYLSESLRAPQHINIDLMSVKRSSPQSGSTNPVGKIFSAEPLTSTRSSVPAQRNISQSDLATTYSRFFHQQFGVSADCNGKQTSVDAHEQSNVQYEGVGAARGVLNTENSSNISMHQYISGQNHLGLTSAPYTNSPMHSHPNGFDSLPTPKFDLGTDGLISHSHHSLPVVWSNTISSNGDSEDPATFLPFSEFYSSLHNFSQSDISTIMSFPVAFTPDVENVSGANIFGLTSAACETNSNLISNTDWLRFMENEGLMDLDSTGETCNPLE